MSSRTTGSIGQEVWPGLLKAVEEGGELQQVIGKLLAYPVGTHPDGGPHLRIRLTNEVADLMAALDFVVLANGLDAAAIGVRVAEKFARFYQWHQDGLNENANWPTTRSPGDE